MSFDLGESNRPLSWDLWLALSSSICEFLRLSLGGEVLAGNLKAGASGIESFRLARCAPGPGPGDFGPVLVPICRREAFGLVEFGGKE